MALLRGMWKGLSEPRGICTWLNRVEEVEIWGGWRTDELGRA